MMNKLNMLVVCFLSCLSSMATAQEGQPFTPDPSYSNGVKYREIIINTTPLIAQFVPFNASTVSKLNIFDYEYRQLKNGKGWRWSLGINITSNTNAAKETDFNMRFGYIKKRQLSKHFHFTRAWDANFIQGSFDGKSTPSGKLGFSGGGISYAPGIEYVFNNFIALSTEGVLFLGLFPIDNNKTQVIKFIPPVSLCLHVKF
jgi:hypothetical protein